MHRKLLHHVKKEVYKRFWREIDTLATLNHPNIVTLYHADYRQAYFIMEYLNGGNLAEYLQSPDFKLLQGVRIIKQILNGLSFAHEKGLIHRDLKPHNILFSSVKIPKIADFGTAKVTTDECITRGSCNFRNSSLYGS